MINEGFVPAANIEEKPFSFSGTGTEYFGIWIVNLLLSIVTLGIYTAWAKVRRLRYFYGNTFLDGHNFEYHAQPKQILIGRIIVVGILVLFQVLTLITPFAFFLIIPYLIAIPWIINKAIRFNARMTSYRNIRLGFEGSYWRSLGIFVGMPIAVAFSGGLIAPIGSKMASDYMGNGLRFGTAEFETDAPLGKLFGNLGMTILFTIGCAVVLGIVGVIVAASFDLSGLLSALTEGEVDNELDSTVASGIFAGVFGFYIAIFFAYLFYAAGVRNIAFNATKLDKKHHFSSEVSRVKYVWILFTNFLAVVATIGLLRPWATVRTWRYLIDKTTLITSGSLDNFVGQTQNEGNVGAAEFLDIEGIDFGL